jgi:energy-coupling factor transporter ATP-binding protein EcfA2
MTTLNDLIQINSTNSDAAIVVNRGLNNHNLVDSFAPTKSAVAVLKHLREAVLPTATQEQRSLNIFGSYGSGKSHLAVVMAHLLHDGSGDIAFDHFFERLRNFGESTLAENLKNTFLNSNDVDAKPYLLVSLYGSKTPSLGSMLMEGLYDAIERHPKLNPADILPATEYDVCVKRFETMVENKPEWAKADLSEWDLAQHYFTTEEMVDDLKNHQPIALETFKNWHQKACAGAMFNPATEGGSNFIDAYFEAGKNLSEKHGYGGIVVLWDELGLALENLISNPLRDTIGEIFDLQAFVEKACAPVRGHTLFLGLTHVSFQQYGSNLDESVKNRLEAIFGRFRAFKIELSAAESEGYHLLGMQRMWTDYGLQQLENSRVNQLKIAAICSALPLFKTLEQNALNTLSEEIYPLHPVMAAGLFALSKMAQANRTALTFFRENANEILARHVDENQLFERELVRLPELVDYYEPTIKDKKSHELERYQRAVGKINADATEQEIHGRKSILKLLLLNELLGEANFQTNEAFLACALYDAEPNTSESETLHLDLAWLKGAELIWKNDLTQQWTLLGDSGVNVEKLIEEKLNHFAGRSAETLLKNYPTMCDDLLPILGEHKLEPSLCGIVRSYNVELLTPPITNTLKLDNPLISGKLYLVLAKDQGDVAQVKERIQASEPANVYFWIPTNGIRAEAVIYGGTGFKLGGLLCRYLSIELLLKEKTATDDLRRQLQAKLERTRQDLLNLFKIFYGRDGLTSGKSELWQAGTAQALNCKSWNEFKNLLAKQINEVYPNEIPIRANNMNELNDEKYTGSRKVQKIVDCILEFETNPAYQTDLLGEDKETSEPSALIDGILDANDLFIQRHPNKWDIKSIEETDGKLKDVLTLMRDTLSRKRENPYIISKLRDELIAPPYGIPSCNLAIFAAVAIRDKVKQLRFGATGNESDFATNLNNAFEKGSKITIRVFDFSNKQLNALILVGKYFKIVNSFGKSSEEYAMESANHLRRFVTSQPDVIKNSTQLHEKTKDLVKFFQAIAKSPQEIADKLLDLIGNDLSEQALHELLDDFERVENVNRHDIKQTLQKVIPKDIEEKAQLVARLNHQSATPQAKAVAQIFEQHLDVNEIDVKHVTLAMLNKPFEECSEKEIGQCQGKLESLIEHHTQLETLTTETLIVQLRQQIDASKLSSEEIKNALQQLLSAYE